MLSACQWETTSRPGRKSSSDSHGRLCTPHPCPGHLMPPAPGPPLHPRKLPHFPPHQGLSHPSLPLPRLFSARSISPLKIFTNVHCQQLSPTPKAPHRMVQTAPPATSLPFRQRLPCAQSTQEFSSLFYAFVHGTPWSRVTFLPSSNWKISTASLFKSNSVFIFPLKHCWTL